MNTTIPRINTVQIMCSCHSYEGTKKDLQAQHLTSSMTIPWKPDAQKGVYRYTTSLREFVKGCV